MTDDDQKSLATQIITNPLFEAEMDKLEHQAIESLVHAQTEQSRVEAQWRVRSVRTFRQDLEQIVSTRAGKVAPA